MGGQQDRTLRKHTCPSVLYSGNPMLCNVCEWTDFVPAEYVLEDGRRAPALQCTGCGAIVLDESAAETEEERDTVKVAVAKRAEIIAGGPLSSRKQCRRGGS